jgi:hypothetical protein
MEPNPSTSVVRKLITGISSVAAVLVLGWLGYQFVYTPRLIITAPSGSHITVITAEDNKQVASQTAASSTTTLWVRPGSYRVLVEQGNAAEAFYALLNAWAEDKLTFAAPQAANLQLARRQVAYDVIPSADQQLSYFNTSSKVVETTNTDGTIQRLVPDFITQIPKDQDPCGGCLAAPQAFEPLADHQAAAIFYNTPVVMKDQQFTPLQTTGLPERAAWRTATLATASSSIVLAVDTTLYRYTSPDSAPEKIIVLEKQFDRLTVSGDKVIVYSTRMPRAKEDIRAAYNDYALDPIVVDMNTKTQHTLTNGPVDMASIAPDGKHALLQFVSGTSTLYDLDNPQHGFAAANSSILAPLWIDNNHYLYASNASLWNMDIAGHSAKLVGIIPSGQAITSITADPDQQLYYITAYNSETDNGIYTFPWSQAQ